MAVLIREFLLRGIRWPIEDAKFVRIFRFGSSALIGMIRGGSRPGIQRMAIGCLALSLLGEVPHAGAQDRGNLIQNGGFETQVPALPIPPDPPGPPTGSYFRQIDASQVPPWNTSASDNKIELWSSGFSASSGGPVFTIAPAQATAAGDVFSPSAAVTSLPNSMPRVQAPFLKQ